MINLIEKIKPVLSLQLLMKKLFGKINFDLVRNNAFFKTFLEQKFDGLSAALAVIER